MKKKLLASVLTLSLIVQSLLPVSAAGEVRGIAISGANTPAYAANTGSTENRTIVEGKNTLTYAPGENCYYLNTTGRAAYAMKLELKFKLNFFSELYGAAVESDSFTTFVFPEAGEYTFYLLNEDDEELTKNGSFTLYVEPRRVLSDFEVKLKPDFESGIPNSYDYILSAFDVTAIYDDGTTESSFIEGSLTEDYDFMMDIVDSNDKENYEPIDYETTTGPAWLMVLCDTCDITKFIPITLIDSDEYEAAHPDDGDDEDDGSDSGSDEDPDSGAGGSGSGSDKTGSGSGSGSIGGSGSGSVSNPTKPGSSSPGGSQSGTTIVSGKAFRLNASSIPLKTGQSTRKVKASVIGRGDRIVSWKSSNPKIVKVSKSGKITARNKTGKATLTAKTAKGLTAKLKVTVQRGSVKTKKISGVPKSLKLKRGKKTTLRPSLVPLTSSQKISYKSSNKKVATVSAKGVIRAKKAGKTTITVKSGSHKISCRVTVTK